jgi:hypothetical protein
MCFGVSLVAAVAGIVAAHPVVTPAADAGAPAAAWTQIFALPEKDSRFFISVWAGEDGRLVAVGGQIIVQSKVGGAFETIELPEKHALYDVWGRTADDVIAVGWRQLIMRFVDHRWITERPPQEGNPRQLLLYSVGPFFPDTIVAYGPGPEGLKRVSGAWQPFTRQDEQAIRRRIGMDEPWNKPCRAGTGARDAMRDGRAWVVCNDRHVLIQRGDRFESRGRAPGRCLSGRGVNGTVLWKEDLFMLCDGEVWRNHGQKWEREITPAKVDALFATSTCLYAVGKHAIMKRC